MLSFFGTDLLTPVLPSVFTRWKNDRKESLARGGNGQPELLKHDWQFIQIGESCAERL